MNGYVCKSSMCCTDGVDNGGINHNPTSIHDNTNHTCVPVSIGTVAAHSVTRQRMYMDAG